MCNGPGGDRLSSQAPALLPATDVFLVTLLALKLINIKFLLVSSMLYNFEILNPKATVLVEI